MEFNKDEDFKSIVDIDSVDKDFMNIDSRNNNLTGFKTHKNGKIYKLFFVLMSINLLLSVAILCVTVIAGKSNSKSNTENDVNVNATVNDEYVSKKDNEAVDDEKEETNDENDVISKGEYKTVDDLKAFIKSHLSEGKGTVEMLREVYPEDVIIYDSNKFLFIPVDESLKKNDINNDDLKILDNGEIEYKAEGAVSIKGIDVSKYQGDIDWKKVANDGVEFAIIRLGYRGYGTGLIMLDEKAKQNIEEASKNGIKVGVYFFSQAITKAEAKEEAEFVLENIKGYDIDYPIVFDTEDVIDDDARAGSLSVDERTEIAITFCEHIKENGFTPVIYANLRWFNLALDMSRLEDYDKWYAYYDEEIYFPYKISMWQYSENGKVDGIEGPVDMNISFKEW